MEAPQPPPAPTQPSPLRKMAAVASIAAGVQFGWALQLSLLTPYVQPLGIPHKWAAYIWLCGPISGLLVQPIVGYHSDRSTSRFGRRQPFITAGALAIVIAAFLIGYSADIGHALGDPLTGTRPRAIAVFVVGFWIFDVANNVLQGPLRAFLGDLAAGDGRKTRTANSLFSFFMAVGNVGGYAAGTNSHLYRQFLPFTKTIACDHSCANLKCCFIISVTLLLVLATAAMLYVKEEAQTQTVAGDDGGMRCFGGLFSAFLTLNKPMWILLLVTSLNWLAWFPFFQFDTDYVGREVFGGEKAGQLIFYKGVQWGTLGLMLNSVVLGATSLGMERLSRGVGGVKRLWGIANLLLAVGLGLTVLVAKLAKEARHYGGVGGHEVLQPDAGIKAGTLILFTILGIPLAVTFSIPFALASIFSSTTGAGQGLSLGVLNISIAIPQMVVSLVIGNWNEQFGGGNLPAFVAGAVAAAASGILSLVLLPSPPPDLANAAAGGGH